MFKQKKLSSGARFGIYVASFLLGVLLFLSSFTTALIANIRIVTSEDHIRGFVREMISAPAHIRPKAPIRAGQGSVRIAQNTRTYQMPRYEEPTGLAEDLKEQLIDMFYEEMTEQLEEEIPFTPEEFRELIDKSTVKDYIADKTASLITDYFNDEITTVFEPEEVLQLIEENNELIVSITGEPLPEDISSKIATIFDNNEMVVKIEAEGLAGFMSATGEDSSILSIGKNNWFVNNVIPILRKAISVKTMILGITMSLILVAAIILINCRQLPKGLRRAGYPLMMAGSLVILNLLAKFVPGMWNIFPGMKLIRYTLLQTAVVNIIVFGLGIALFISGIVLGIVLKTKKVVSVFIPSKPATAEAPSAIAEETPAEEEIVIAQEIPSDEPIVEEEPLPEGEPIAEEAPIVAEEPLCDEEPAPIGE